jgi:hypothetical protein
MSLPPLLTEDFIGVMPSGEYFNKAAFVRHYCVRDLGLMGVRGHDINAATIRVYGNTAIVNRKIHDDIKLSDGSRPEFDVQRIECCIKQNGKWQIASSQATVINPAQQAE